MKPSSNHSNDYLQQGNSSRTIHSLVWWLPHAIEFVRLINLFSEAPVLQLTVAIINYYLEDADELSAIWDIRKARLSYNLCCLSLQSIYSFSRLLVIYWPSYWLEWFIIIDPKSEILSLDRDKTITWVFTHETFHQQKSFERYSPFQRYKITTNKNTNEKYIRYQQPVPKVNHQYRYIYSDVPFSNLAELTAIRVAD